MFTATVIVAAIYTLLQTILDLLVQAAIRVSNEIMDESITVFSANTNIFETFTSLLPFPEGLNINAIIKGIAYGILLLLLTVSIIKSISSIATGEPSENPIQVAIRVVVTILLINIIFGFNFSIGGGTLNYTGLLGSFGKWFSTILSKNVKATAEINFAWNGLEPARYFVQLIMIFSLLTSTLGAAVTYVERILSFALYILFGPIAVSMHANKETSETCKQWIIGVFSQFLAIFISLVLWQSYIIQINDVFSDSGAIRGLSLFKLAIAIAILGLMRNSEKILNSFGIRTMANMDSARAITSGAISLMTGLATAARFAGRAGNKVERSKNGAFAAQASLYDNNGSLNARPLDGFKNEKGNITPASIYSGVKNRGQYKAANAMRTSIDSYNNAIKNGTNNNSVVGNSNTHNGVVAGVNNSINANANNNSNINGVNNNSIARPSVSAETVNKGFGLKEGSPIQAIGDKEGNMHYAVGQAISGNEVQGFMGNASYINHGQKQMMQEAFFVVNGSNETLAPGTSVGVGADGSERFIDPKSSGPVVDQSGNQIYATISESERENMFANSYAESNSFANSSMASDETQISYDDVNSQPMYAQDSFNTPSISQENIDMPNVSQESVNIPNISQENIDISNVNVPNNGNVSDVNMPHETININEEMSEVFPTTDSTTEDEISDEIDIDEDLFGDLSLDEDENDAE